MTQGPAIRKSGPRRRSGRPSDSLFLLTERWAWLAPMKALNRGCGAERLGLEFRMELAAQEPGMVAELDDLDQVVLGVLPRELQSPASASAFLVFGVELVAMAVALEIMSVRCRPGRRRSPSRAGRRIRPAAWSRPDRGSAVSSRHRKKILWGVSASNSVLFASFRPGHVPGEFDGRALHAEADAEEGHLVFAGVGDRPDLALDAADAEPARNQDAVLVR